MVRKPPDPPPPSCLTSRCPGKASIRGSGPSCQSLLLNLVKYFYCVTSKWPKNTVMSPKFYRGWQFDYPIKPTMRHLHCFLLACSWLPDSCLFTLLHKNHIDVLNLNLTVYKTSWWKSLIPLYLFMDKESVHTVCISRSYYSVSVWKKNIASKIYHSPIYSKSTLLSIINIMLSTWKKTLNAEFVTRNFCFGWL